MAGLDTPASGGEFQRADCAPRTTLGDGKITVTDWVQAGRYAAGLDPITAVGGPTVPAPGAPAALHGVPAPGGTVRTLQVSSATAVQGVAITLTVSMQSLGNENAVSFSLAFDPTAFKYSSISLGSAATGALLDVNTNQLATGKVGLALSLPIGNSFAAGLCEIAKINLVPAAIASGNYSATIEDQPVPRGISDPSANELSAGYLLGTITVKGLPQLIITPSGTNVILAWPVWAQDFTLQGCDGSAFSTGAWTDVHATLQTNGDSISAPVGISGKAQFFRLQHP